jgi:hypothetical protein
MDQCKPSLGEAMNARLACSANFAISAFQDQGIAGLMEWAWKSSSISNPQPRATNFQTGLPRSSRRAERGINANRVLVRR